MYTDMGMVRQQLRFQPIADALPDAGQLRANIRRRAVKAPSPRGNG